MAKKSAPPVEVPTQTDHTKVRTAGLQILTPLQPLVVSMKIRNTSEYLDADALLGRIRNARLKWANLLDPVKGPVTRMEQELKLLKQGVKRLDAEIDEPLDALEQRVKAAMRDFKIEEQRQLQAAEDERRREEAKLQAEIEAKRRQEEAARTAPMKARLAEVREKLEAKRDEALQGDLNPAVKGSSSSVRKVQKVRITDLAAFVGAMQDYQPKAGIYEFHAPPVTLISVEMLQPGLNKIFRDQPNVVATWPGCIIEEDIIIAGR